MTFLVNIPFSSIFFFFYQFHPTQGKKRSFEVLIKHQGKMFKEVVEIDVKGKTETFHVPLQGDLEAAEIINDFRKVSHCPDMTSKSVK